MNPRFLAISLAMAAACTLWGAGLLAGDGVRQRDPALAACAAAAGLILAAIFANAAADLW